MIRRFVLLAMCLVSSLTIATVSPSGAATSDRCVDPGAGGHRTLAPPGGTYYDQKWIDEQGRLLVLETTPADTYYSDRLVRFLPDGRVDTSFGSAGFAVLPGVSRSFRMRNIAVEPSGRIWTMRATFANEFEVQRFLDNGTLDSTFERYLYHENGLLDPAGDLEIAADGVSLLIAFGRQVGDAPGGAIQLMTIRPDTVQESRVGSGYMPGIIPSVVDVTSDGWVAGRLATIEDTPEFFGFGWHWWPGFGENMPYRTMQQGLLSSIETLADGRVIGVGYALVDGQTDGLVVQFDPDPDAFGDTQSLGFSERTIDIGGSSDGIARLLPDGTAVAFTGDTAADIGVGFGAIRSDGDIVLGPVARLGVDSAVPVEGRVRRDGRIGLAGFTDGGSAWQATFTTPTPDLSAGALDGQIQRLYSAYFGRPADGGGLSFWRSRRAEGATLESVSNAFAGSPEFAATYGELTDDAFVRLVYRNVLGREGDSGGISFWTAELANGRRSRGRVMLGFSESSENVARTGTPAPYPANAGSLLRLYRAYFDRAPDASGACFWIATLDGGATLSSVSESFASSREFLDTYGALSDAAFVELVYRNVLGREGDPAGLAFWTDALSSGRRTRGEVLVGFSESPEYVIATGTLPRR